MPPQSSHKTRTTDVLQNLLRPTASTIDDTQTGPLALFDAGWSEFIPDGVTHVTDDSVPAATSARNCDAGATMCCCHAPPVRMWRIASYALQLYAPTSVTGSE